jgi:hypothetical protein
VSAATGIDIEELVQSRRHQEFALTKGKDKKAEGFVHSDDFQHLFDLLIGNNCVIGCHIVRQLDIFAEGESNANLNFSGVEKEVEQVPNFIPFHHRLWNRSD